MKGENIKYKKRTCAWEKDIPGVPQLTVFFYQSVI